MVEKECCVETQKDYEIQRKAFFESNPKACRQCDGSGAENALVEFDYSTGLPLEDDPCAHCEGAEKPVCAVCAAPLRECFERSCDCLLETCFVMEAICHCYEEEKTPLPAPKNAFEAMIDKACGLGSFVRDLLEERQNN